MKYLLIDGNNLAIRSAFANEQLTNVDGVPTGAHYGVFQSLILLKKDFNEHQFLVVWDGKSARRMAEAQSGVNKMICPSGYKENRPKGEEKPQPLKDFYDQADYLKRGIGAAGIPQIRLSKYEADDVIASYASLLKEHNEVFVVTSDRDYWQMLDDNVTLWDGMKLETTTKASWMEEYGMEPERAIDIGALMGDVSDNIFGIPGWGVKTAVKELKKYGTWEGIYKAYHDKYDSLREEYPDFCSVPYNAESCHLQNEEFEAMGKIIEAITEKKRRIYPEVTVWHPWAGVVVAFHEKKVKIPKSALMALVYEDRVGLAYSLKKMDDDIPDLPAIESGEFDREKLTEYLEYYDIHSLHDDIDVFVEG